MDSHLKSSVSSSTVVKIQIVVICIIASASFSGSAKVQNNVCPTIHDYFNIENNNQCWYNFAAEVGVPEIIKRTGYPFMEYKVQTKDGYILTVFRIPSVNKKKPAVFLLHGVQCTSGIFVGLGRNSLAFLLADAGYDVWLGNYRGTEYSNTHATLNNTQKEYWDYGHDEIGLIDVPTMLRLVSFHSGHKGKIIYIGHSLGTTAALIYASSYPEHAKSTVGLFVCLSPAYKLSHMMSPYRLALPFFPFLLRILNDLNLVQLVSRGSTREVTKPTCLASPVLMMACLTAVNLFVGPFSQISPETIPVLFNQFPGGTSFKTLTYIKEATEGKFRRYDYGPRNMFQYGTVLPPVYNVSKIEVPFYLMYSSQDWATPKSDALNLFYSLPKSARYGKHEIRRFNFNHFDFCFGRDAKTLVYDVLLKVLDKYLTEEDEDPNSTKSDSKSTAGNKNNNNAVPSKESNKKQTVTTVNENVNVNIKGGFQSQKIRSNVQQPLMFRHLQYQYANNINYY